MTRTKATLLLGAALLALLTAACAVPESVRESTSNAANGVVNLAREGAGIKEQAGAREIILDLNPETSSVGMIMSMVEPIVADAAADGAVIEMWMVTGGVAAAMTPIDLEAANGGDLRFEGKNATAWGRETEENTRAVLDAVELALNSLTRDETGADLFGALEIAADRVTILPGSDDSMVYLITGGGIHRTSSLDLQRVDFTAASPLDVAAEIPRLDAPAVAVQVIGAGRFPNVSPPPEAIWAAGVRSTWEAFCESSTTRTCIVSDVAMTEEG